jgi:hypothetical protein
MNPFFNWLSTPYYFNPSIKFKFKASLIHGVFIFFFLNVFKPFSLYEFEIIIFEYTLGISIISFLGTFFTLYIPALIFKKYFNENNWTIGKNLLLIIVAIAFIGVVLWCFEEIYKEQYNLRKLGILEFIYNTFLVSLIPLTFFIFINEKSVRERREKKVLEIKEIKRKKKISNSKKLSREVRIISDNGKESITFYIDKLVYITSQGNYASFFLKNNGNLKEKILRITLTKIATELKDYSNIIRCHKSYLVNINEINDISGNARGYLLKLDFIPVDIPVSRKFSKQSIQSLLR